MRVERVLRSTVLLVFVGCVGEVSSVADGDSIAGASAAPAGPRCEASDPAEGFVVDDIGHHARVMYTLPLGLPGEQPMVEATARAFRRIVYASNYQVGLSPGDYAAFRHHDDQQALYDAFVVGAGNFAMLPDWSNHQGGTAIDVSAGLPWLQAWGRCFGWFRPWPLDDEVIRGMGVGELTRLARDLATSPRHADPTRILHAGCPGQVFTYGPYLGSDGQPDRDTLAHFTRDALRCESWHWEYDRALELAHRDTDACRAVTTRADEAALGGHACLRTPDDGGAGRCANRCYLTDGHANVNDTHEGCTLTGEVVSDTDGRECYACTANGWELAGGLADPTGMCIVNPMP